MNHRSQVVIGAVILGVVTIATFLFWFAVKRAPKEAVPIMTNTLSAGYIGKPLDFHKKIYGDEFEVYTYRPDLYPTSYIFKKESISVTLTPLPIDVAEIDVFFETAPSEPVELLLERYSSVAGWENRSLSDPGFELHFPGFSKADARNSFFAANDVAALVQRDVGFGKLVLWIHAGSYPSLLEEYRRTKHSP